MKLHIVQHVTFEEPGVFLDWAKSEGHQVNIIDPAKNKLPTSEETDFLIILGGPMSVHDETEFPWLAQEKKSIKTFIADNKKPLLGICLGAQLIADVLGAKVYKNTQREIGWFDIDIKNNGLFKNIPQTKARVFHWHGEILDLPLGAKLLASSQATPVQAFQYGEKVLALQFHPEMNAETLKKILDECAHEIKPEQKFEQSEKEILRLSPRALPESQYFLKMILGILKPPK